VKIVKNQSRDSPHLARHEAIARRSLARHEGKYPIGTRFKGASPTSPDYGAVRETRAGIEGLIHVSEMSWNQEDVHPGKIVSTSQEIEVQVLEVDRSSAAFRSVLQADNRNPWKSSSRNIRRHDT